MTTDYEERVFGAIAEGNGWRAGETVSGPGSTLIATETLRRELLQAFQKLRLRSIVDAPCGDMNWMRYLGYPFEKYIGIDIVDGLIARLNQDIWPTGYHFQPGNITTDILPQADALLCRDCLVHLPFAKILRAMDLWRRAGFRYVFTTTFPSWAANEDCDVGGWRALNLQKAPFYWPEPLLLIDEQSGNPPPYHDKSVGVWAL